MFHYASTQMPELASRPTRLQPPQSERNHDRAMSCAVEYRRLVEKGEDDAAHDIAKHIDRLVGRYIDGRTVWPKVVREAAGMA